MIAGWLNKHSLNFKLNIGILTCVCCIFFALIYFITKRAEPIIISQIDNLAFKSVSSYAEDFEHLISDAEQIVTNTKNTLNQMDKNDTTSLKAILNSAIRTIEHSGLLYTEAWVYEFPAEDVSTGTLFVSKNLKNKK